MKKEMFKYEIQILKDTFSRLLRRKAQSNLTKLIKKTHPADLAILFRYFTDDEQMQIFKLMSPNSHLLEFLVGLDDIIIGKLLNVEDPKKVASIIQNASTNNQSFLLRALNQTHAQTIIHQLNKEDQEKIEAMMAYPKDSAGSLMSTDVFTLYQGTTCTYALKTLQHQKDAEMVFYLYITDEDNSLMGVASLRALATTASDTILKDIMIKNVHCVRPETDQEDVAQLVARYNYLAVPVVNDENQLLGIVTVDDVVDVIREEASEDFLKMAGAGKDREILLKSSWDNAKTRLPWLFASWIGGVIAASVIGLYENMLESTIALTAFIPVIIGMGGNIGTQTSTIIVRGIATGRIEIGNELKIVIKEVKVGFILGLLYGLLLGMFSYLKFINANPMLGVVVGLSICSSMLLAVTVGSLIPLMLRKLEIDPAIATGPFVTTSIDILGVLFYFVIAGILLEI